MSKKYEGRRTGEGSEQQLVAAVSSKVWWQQ